jgi:hypothetical protein
MRRRTHTYTHTHTHTQTLAKSKLFQNGDSEGGRYLQNFSTGLSLGSPLNEKQFLTSGGGKIATSGSRRLKNE